MRSMDCGLLRTKSLAKSACCVGECELCGWSEEEAKRRLERMNYEESFAVNAKGLRYLKVQKPVSNDRREI